MEVLDQTQNLGWLPNAAFRGPLRGIVSASPGLALATMERRGWPTLTIPPLNTDECRRLVVEHLARYRKALDHDSIERIARTPAASNPLFVRVVFDELRVKGTFEDLRERLCELS